MKILMSSYEKDEKNMTFIFYFLNFYLMEWEVGDNLQKTQKKPSKTKFKQSK